MFAKALQLLLLVAACFLPATGSGKEPEYARFAKGEWQPAFTDEDSLQGGTNAEIKDGVVTLDDGFLRDNSAGAVAAADVIVRAKIRGRGSIAVRCKAESYGAWFGEGMAGVNKFVDSKVHVLGSRRATLDPRKFHEMALAAVGNRVILFIDGRRLIDVVDKEVEEAGPIALQAHKTKADFVDIDVMSLDGIDAKELLPEQEPLAKGLGTWDVERTLTAAGQAPKKSTGVMHVERSIGGFYLIRSTASDGTSSLFVTQFLPEEPAIRTWVFFSSGRMDRYDKTIDPDTGLQTIPPQPAQGGVMSGTIRPIDANTSETRFKTVAPGGKTISEFASLNKRRAKAGKSPDLRAEGPAKGGAEVAGLAPYVGRWTMEVQLHPTKFEPKARTEKYHDDTEWILGGRFLMRFETTPTGELKSFHIAGYDPKAKAFVFTAFQATGNVIQWNSTWDADAKAFQTTMIGIPEGWSGAGSDRVVDQDTLESDFLFNDDQGGVLWDAKVVRRRRD